MEIKKCYNCGHKQEITEKVVYQDIRGKYVICEYCKASYDVEMKEE